MGSWFLNATFLGWGADAMVSGGPMSTPTTTIARKSGFISCV